MPSNPQQQRRRDQVESVLRLASPVLDLVLAVGDRVSRVIAPSDEGGMAIAAGGERLRLAPLPPRGERPRPTGGPEA
jgi:hypothetical protein